MPSSAGPRAEQAHLQYYSSSLAGSRAGNGTRAFEEAFQSLTKDRVNSTAVLQVRTFLSDSHVYPLVVLMEATAQSTAVRPSHGLSGHRTGLGKINLEEACFCAARAVKISQPPLGGGNSQCR